MRHFFLQHFSDSHSNRLHWIQFGISKMSPLQTTFTTFSSRQFIYSHLISINFLSVLFNKIQGICSIRVRYFPYFEKIGRLLQEDTKQNNQPNACHRILLEERVFSARFVTANVLQEFNSVLHYFYCYYHYYYSSSSVLLLLLRDYHYRNYHPRD